MDSRPIIVHDIEKAMKLPEHKCGLYLQHNQHRDYYQSAAEWITDNDLYDWKDEASKQTAIDSDSIWTLQWYPDTPIGFYSVAAPTLEDLLELANSVS
jgi:hypothetical protein